MSICSSLLLGTEGKYSILGQQVEFINTDEKIYSFSTDFISKTAEALLTSSFFRIGTLGYLHTFIHEMGHALVVSFLTKKTASITLYSKMSLGYTIMPQAFGRLSPMGNTLVNMSGPLADIIFSIALIFGSFALQSRITAPVAMGIRLGAITWIFGEFLYAANSLVNQDDGDFAYIAREGPLHLVFASSVIVGVLALGVFAITKVK